MCGICDAVCLCVLLTTTAAHTALSIHHQLQLAVQLLHYGWYLYCLIVKSISLALLFAAYILTQMHYYCYQTVYCTKAVHVLQRLASVCTAIHASIR
jgi:hypothetical protein